MDSMYENYIKERENLSVIKTDYGFITYRIEFPNCLIADCFVLPIERQNGHGSFLTNQVFEICKGAGVKTVHCQSDENANGHSLSSFAIENFGFEWISKTGTINHYKMEVSEWDRV